MRTATVYNVLGREEVIMGVPENLKDLVALSLLKDMPDAARQRVAELIMETANEVELADGAALFHQGDLGSDAGFALLRGTVRIEREGLPPVTTNAPAILGEIQQFNPRAQRTATVRAAGPVKALRFTWQALYEKAREAFTPEEQHRLMDALEKGVCERLACERLVDVPIFRGLPDPLTVRASLILHWLAQRVRVPDGATLFEQNALCGGTGFLLLHGCVELRIAGRFSQGFNPPCVLGVMPQFDPDLRWSATATAKGDIELLKFSWLNYVTMLQRRLAPGELDQLMKSVAAAGDACFAH